MPQVLSDVGASDAALPNFRSTFLDFDFAACEEGGLEGEWDGLILIAGLKLNNRIGIMTFKSKINFSNTGKTRELNWREPKRWMQAKGKTQ